MSFLAAQAEGAGRHAIESEVGMRVRERFHEFIRRLRRASLIFVGSVAFFVLFSIAIGSISLLLWFLILPLAATAAALSLLWPTRRGHLNPNAARPRRSLAALAGSSRLWLMSQMGRLAPQSREAARRAVTHLASIASTPPGAPVDPLLLREAERQIGGHLRRLIESYCMLPPEERGKGSKADEHLTESLTAVATELGELSTRLSDERSRRFEIEHRFIGIRFPKNDTFAEAQ